MTAFYLALAVLGFLLGAPFWMHYALRQDQERRDWEARRRAREMRR